MFTSFIGGQIRKNGRIFYDSLAAENIFAFGDNEAPVDNRYEFFGEMTSIVDFIFGLKTGGFSIVGLETDGLSLKQGFGGKH